MQKVLADVKEAFQTDNKSNKACGFSSVNDSCTVFIFKGKDEFDDRLGSFLDGVYVLRSQRGLEILRHRCPHIEDVECAIDGLYELTGGFGVGEKRNPQNAKKVEGSWV